MKKTLAGALAVTAALSAAGIAWAENDHNAGKLGGSTLTATWEGVGSGVLGAQDLADAVGCQPGIHECYDAVIEVTEAGTLTVKTSSTDPTAVDTDLQLFTAAADGTVKEQLQESAQNDPTPAEQVSARVKPGFFVARIDYTICAACTVQAEASLKPAGTPTAAPGPGTTPDPTQDAPPSVTASKPGSKKVTSFKGTASADTAKVEVGLLKLTGKDKCQDVTAAGKTAKHAGKCTQPGVWFAAKGTTKWTATVKKALKKGNYVLFARATDTAGQTQGGYGKDNRKAFKVKK
jgi:hypothetical protein